MFHDGYLEGIALGNGGATLSIRMEGLEALRIDDFREGNIISHFEVVQGREPPPDAWAPYLERLFEPPHPSAAQECHDRHAALLRAKAALICSGAANLVSISPSCGADLLAFAKTVTYGRAVGEGQAG